MTCYLLLFLTLSYLCWEEGVANSANFISNCMTSRIWFRTSFYKIIEKELALLSSSFFLYEVVSGWIWDLQQKSVATFLLQYSRNHLGSQYFCEVQNLDFMHKMFAKFVNLHISFHQLDIYLWWLIIKSQLFWLSLPILLYFIQV
jgi:hypothetical protein